MEVNEWTEQDQRRRNRTEVDKIRPMCTDLDKSRYNRTEVDQRG